MILCYFKSRSLCSFVFVAGEKTNTGLYLFPRAVTPNTTRGCFNNRNYVLPSWRLNAWTNVSRSDFCCGRSLTCKRLPCAASSRGCPPPPPVLTVPLSHYLFKFPLLCKDTSQVGLRPRFTLFTSFQALPPNLDTFSGTKSFGFYHEFKGTTI